MNKTKPECRWCAASIERIQCGCGCLKWGHKTDRGFWQDCRSNVPPFVDVSTISEYGLTQKLSNQVRVF